MTYAEAQERVSALLFEIHEAAMDASADPNQTSIHRMQKVVRKLERELPLYYWEAANKHHTTATRDIKAAMSEDIAPSGESSNRYDEHDPTSNY